VPWFDVLHGGITTLSADNLRICLVELACYSPLLLIAVWVRRRWRACRHG
jgi:hypothetical protein